MKSKRFLQKTVLGVILLLFGIITLSFGLEKDLTSQEKKDVNSAEEDALNALERGDIYIISGGYVDVPVVDKNDINMVKGLPTKSIGCTGNFEYAKKFNEIVIFYVKQTAQDFVPDEATAIKVAEAVWLPIYGEEIYNEKPFKAVLKGNVWLVSGSLQEGWLGGVATAAISKKDGRILRVVHYK